jgi:DNA primase
MGIVDEDIARVRAETDFLAIAGEHMQLRRAGTQYTGLCPFHAEKSPSFSLNPNLGVYYCFGCGAKGDSITFVMELEHLQFAEAVERLATRAGIKLRYDDAATGRDHQRRARLYEALAEAVAWYHERLLKSPDAAAARRYLRSERGYDGDLVRQYQLGWAPEGWDQLLRSLKIPRAVLVDAGLAQANDQGRYMDFFRGRLLFPIFDPGGRPIGAGGRILPDGRGPKYKNTAGTAVYDKSRVLYGLNWAKQAITAKEQIVICEGYTDVIGLHTAGVGEAVATCGTALADGHIRALVSFARRIVLAYDADNAGQNAAEHYYGWEQRYGVDIRVAALPQGNDPADLARRDPEALQRAVADARPYLQFRLERLFDRADLGTAEGRVRAATSALRLVAGHPNELVRDQYLMMVADRCRIEPDRLRALPVPDEDPMPVAPERRTRSGARPSSPSATPSPSGAPPEADVEPVRLSPQEVVALRLAVHQPEQVAGRLERELFAHPVARGAFDALASATTLSDAITACDPQTAEILHRLAVEDGSDDADDVMVRLVEVATTRAIAELDQELLMAPAEDRSPYIEAQRWLRHTRDALRTADGMPVGSAMDPELQAERLLVAWIVRREQQPDDERGSQENGSTGDQLG